MTIDLKRRATLALLGGMAVGMLSGKALAAPGPGRRADLIAAAWRGKRPTDPYFAGVLKADWDARRLEIMASLELPTRPHGLLVDADGQLLVAGARPGGWLWRISQTGELVNRVDLSEERGMPRLGGHALIVGDMLFTTETDYRNGQGLIGVRDIRSLKKQTEWASGGIEPHQLLADAEGQLMIANGGIYRTLEDKKIDRHRMASSLVRLDRRNGDQLERWQLDDARLSMRHLAWNRHPRDGAPLLGVAMQAEHDDPAERLRAPALAVLAEGRLAVPAGAGAGGYAGDIAPAHRGGFVLSNNGAGVASLWQPDRAEGLQAVIEMQEAYALANWQRDGVLVATAPGLIRWHPLEKPAFLAWPQPMALDNHWILLADA